MIFFNHRTTGTDDNCIIFTAEDASDVIGSCKMLLGSDRADITEISFVSGNEFIVDGLVKAAFNYACYKNYYIGRCSAGNVDFLLDKMNFIKKDGYYENDIPTVLAGSCGSCCG